MSSSDEDWKDMFVLAVIVIALLLIGWFWGVLSVRLKFEDFECTSTGLINGTPECLIYERRAK